MLVYLFFLNLIIILIIIFNLVNFFKVYVFLLKVGDFVGLCRLFIIVVDNLIYSNNNIIFSINMFYE